MVIRRAWVALSASLIALVCALHAGPVLAKKSDFVGAAKCGGCHEREYAVWQGSKHARAGESLGDRRSALLCQSCHSTGDAPLGRPVFDHVGCEACHGAGAGYAPDDIMRDKVLSNALGLRDLSTRDKRVALCRGCHREQTKIAGFNIDEAWRLIRHGKARETQAR